jgi:conjugal transfer/entry exclusion protein
MFAATSRLNQRVQQAQNLNSIAQANAAAAAEAAAFAAQQAQEAAAAEKVLIGMGYTDAQLQGFFNPQATAAQKAGGMTSGGYVQIVFTSPSAPPPAGERLLATSMEQMLILAASLIAQAPAVKILSVGPLQ